MHVYALKLSPADVLKAINMASFNAVDDNKSFIRQAIQWPLHQSVIHDYYLFKINFYEICS